MAVLFVTFLNWVENTVIESDSAFTSSVSIILSDSLFSNEELIKHTFNEYLGLIFLGLVPTILGHNSIYYSMKYVSPTIAAAFPLGEPIIATIFAFFIFSESITPNIFIGGAVTLAGLILISLYKQIK